MNYSQLNVKLQVKDGFKLVNPRIGRVPEQEMALTILKNGFSMPGNLFNSTHGRISIDMSTGKPRLLINPPVIYSSWAARRVNGETTRLTVVSKVLPLFLKAALRIPKAGKVSCQLVGPQFENGVIVYDIKK